MFTTLQHKITLSQKEEGYKKCLSKSNHLSIAVKQVFYLSFLRQSLPEAVGFLESPDSPAVLAEAFANFARSLNIVSYAYLDKLAYESTLVFEGAQGVLLDEWYGFHPYTTWSTTTSENALNLLNEVGYEGETKKIGVLRAYATRHGAGPFVTHDEDLSRLLPDAHNNSEGWQGEFRTGWFDTVMALYALEANVGVDALAITHIDRWESIAHPKWCAGYDVDGTYVRSLRLKTVKEDLIHQEMLTELVTRARPVLTSAPKDAEDYLVLLESALSVPVALTSYGQSALEKTQRSLLGLAH